VLVDFYHLAASPLERVLPQIAEKVLSSSDRLLVVGAAVVLNQLDAQLWSYGREAFLPHGRSEGPAPDAQPILLSEKPDPLNGATNIALVDGQWRDEALTFARAFYFFDNGHIDTARNSWRALSANPPVECRYWKQDERAKWVQGP